MPDLKNNKTKHNAKARSSKLLDFRFNENQLPTVHNSKLKTYQENAWEAYKKSNFPTTKDEAWRRTNIRKLQTEKFKKSNLIEKGLPPETLFAPIISEGEFAGKILSGAVERRQALDPGLKSRGVIFDNLQTVRKENPELLGQLIGQIITGDEGKFTALAAAMAEDGVLLYVPKNIIIDRPFSSFFWGGGEYSAFFNHLIIWVEEGAKVTLMHESASPKMTGDAQIFHDGLVEIHVGRNARLNFVELQSWGDNVWSFTREKAQVMADGHLEWIFGAMGTHLTKNFSDIDLVEPGAMGRMSGFYITGGDQHLDHDTQQNHLAKNTSSDLLYKGALLDESRSVWQGMIYVAPGAVGTDGYQANRNLILSKAARAELHPRIRNPCR